MEQIYPLYRDADVVVLASPLYYWFISGFLKNAFDRLFSIAECDPNYRNPKKQSVLIMAAEGAGFEESEHWYDHLKKHIGWQSLGKVLCGYVTQPGDIEGKKELTDAYELGKSYYTRSFYYGKDYFTESIKFDVPQSRYPRLHTEA